MSALPYETFCDALRLQLHLLFSPSFFFFNDTATTEIYTLSLHDALPICLFTLEQQEDSAGQGRGCGCRRLGRLGGRSEEHTSELQSRQYLVCRLLLEKKKRRLEAQQQEHALVVDRETHRPARPVDDISMH